VSFAPPLEQQYLEHHEGVDVAHRHGAQIDANAAHVGRQRATCEDRAGGDARSAAPADVGRGAARVRFH